MVHRPRSHEDTFSTDIKNRPYSKVFQGHVHVYKVIGASLSEPHINGKAVREMYTYVYMYVRHPHGAPHIYNTLCCIPKYSAQRI